jgi:regulator of sigma E protease
MNFLPIPMLDGGYIMFILFEMITGKKVSDKFIYYANQVGLFIVLALMIFANTDFLRD